MRETKGRRRKRDGGKEVKKEANQMTEENGGRKRDKGDGEERGRLAPEGIAGAE